MLLPQPMAHGRLVSRYKRFFADVVLDDGAARSPPTARTPARCWG